MARVEHPYWGKKRVMVTGGAGFLGHRIVERLKTLGAEVSVPRKKDYDFMSLPSTLQCLSDLHPEIVIHSAAYYGGLGITMAEPGKIFFENLLMGTHLMEASRLAKVAKFLSVGTSCSYPGYLDKPMKESEFWAGPVHDSVIGYGTVKKMLHAQGVAYHKQYGFQSCQVVLANLYGPHDCFDDYRAHGISALIKKFCDAHSKRENVTVWGSGKPVREFLFVDDCAEGIILAAEKFNEVGVLNLGTGIGTSVIELVDTLSQALQFKGTIIWDRTKPDGQIFKTLDVSKMRSILNWVPPTQLATGIQKTVQWYNERFCERPQFFKQAV